MIPAAILAVSFGINYLTNTLGLASDLPSNIIVYIGGVASILFYAYLAFSDIRTFIKEEDGEYALRSIEIDKKIEETKIEYQKIIQESKSPTTERESPNQIHQKFQNMSADNMDSEYIVRTLINSAKQIAVAQNVDVNDIEVMSDVLSEVVSSSNYDVSRFSQFHDIKDIAGHRKAGIYTYWICKLKPFKSGGGIEFINEAAAINLGLSIVGKTEEALNNQQFYSNLLYNLRFRNVGADSLSLIYQSLLGENHEV